MNYEYPLSGKEALKATIKGDVIQDKTELNFYRSNGRSILFFSQPLNAWVKTNLDLENDSDMYRIVPISELIQRCITV